MKKFFSTLSIFKRKIILLIILGVFDIYGADLVYRERSEESKLARTALIILLHGMCDSRSAEAFSIERLSGASAAVVAGMITQFFSKHKLRAETRYMALLVGKHLGKQTLLF